MKGDIDMAHQLYEMALKHAAKTGNTGQIRHIRGLLLEVERAKEKGAKK